jgi:hypothetical protein
MQSSTQWERSQKNWCLCVSGKIFKEGPCNRVMGKSTSPIRVNKKKFKEELEKRKKFPYDHQELTSFFKATYAAYRKIISTQPQVIIAPFRGAEPIMKAIFLYASLEGKSHQMPKVAWPRAGEQSIEHSIKVEKLSKNHAPAMSTEEKKQEFERIIHQAVKRSNGKPTRVVVVDEVIHGGSITNTIALLKNASDKMGKNVTISGFAIAEMGQVLKGEYRHLRSKGTINEFPVRRMFITDSPLFLRPLRENRKMYPLTLRGRPHLGVSAVASQTNLDLLADLSELHSQKKKQQHHTVRPRNQRIKRLPTHIARK